MHIYLGLVQTLQGETCHVLAKYGAIVRANAPMVADITHVFADGSKYIGEAVPARARGKVKHILCVYVCV